VVSDDGGLRNAGSVSNCSRVINVLLDPMTYSVRSERASSWLFIERHTPNRRFTLSTTRAHVTNATYSARSVATLHSTAKYASSV